MAKSSTITANTTTASGTLFLPDFCNIRMVFAIGSIAELLAFLIVLASSTTILPPSDPNRPALAGLCVLEKPLGVACPPDGSEQLYCARWPYGN
jgi:hypothetical protein